MASMVQHTVPSPWFNCQKPNPQASMRLFCFPYAGGGSVLYRGWEQHLPTTVEIWPVQLPGRGSRYKESPFDSMQEIVSGLAKAIRPFLDLPFCFFGHSLGAMMSFELAHRLSEKFDLKVSHLFVSGARGPHLPRVGPNVHHLPDDQFISELKSLNGTPPEVFEHPELIRMMMTTLRADFKIAEMYSCSSKPPLDCPITAFGGLADNLVSRQDLEAWQIQTTNSFELWQLPGDHFFLQAGDSEILQILSQQLRKLTVAETR